jgi:putative endonuclease
MYNVHDLVYYEKFDIKKQAKQREKQLKNWHKDWK